VFVLSTNQKGAIAEMKIATAAVELGVPVLKPMQEYGRYDLAFEIARRLLRVQCKWGALDPSGAVIVVALTSKRLTPAGYVQSPYTQDEIDAVAVYCGALDRCYLLPVGLVVGRTAIHLRVKPPLNGQRACIQLATEFEFQGAVAQLEERDAGSVEARGSSPLSSTSSRPLAEPFVRVGSHQFRNHFGYYLERAAAGAEVHISRHGRPFARLLPAEARQPELEAA
jgi:prevent-host-death family protein